MSEKCLHVILGLVLLVISAVMVAVMREDCGAAFLTVPMGLFLIFARE